MTSYSMSYLEPITLLHYRVLWYRTGLHPVQHWAMASRLEILLRYLAALGAPELACELTSLGRMTSHGYGGQWSLLLPGERLAWLRLARYALSGEMDQEEEPEYRCLTYLKLIDAAYRCDGDTHMADRAIVPVVISTLDPALPTSLPSGLSWNGLSLDLTTAIKMIREVYRVDRCTGTEGDLVTRSVGLDVVVEVLQRLERTARGTDRAAGLARWRLAILFSGCDRTDDLRVAVIQVAGLYRDLPGYWPSLLLQADRETINGSSDWLSAQLDCVSLWKGKLSESSMMQVARTAISIRERLWASRS